MKIFSSQNRQVFNVKVLMENKTQVYSDGNTEAGCEKVLMDEEANVI
jgi:hypothetical protein